MSASENSHPIDQEAEPNDDHDSVFVSSTSGNEDITEGDEEMDTSSFDENDMEDELEEDTKCYRIKICELIKKFKKIERLRITKHWRYTAPLFDSVSDSMVEQPEESEIVRNVKAKNHSVLNLYYHANVIEQYELE